MPDTNKHNEQCTCKLMDRQILNAGAGSYTSSSDWHCPVHGLQHRDYEKPEGWGGSSSAPATDVSWEIETLSAKLHDIYMQEARRQGDVRHKDAYADLTENIKEFDRVLARFILEQIDLAREKGEAAAERDNYAYAKKEGYDEGYAFRGGVESEQKQRMFEAGKLAGRKEAIAEMKEVAEGMKIHGHANEKLRQGWEGYNEGLQDFIVALEALSNK